MNDTTAQTVQEAAWHFRLYIAGQTPKSLAAISNLHSICNAYLLENCHIEVVDLLKTPHLAERDNVIAIPTLVRLIPAPVRKIIGDLSDMEKTRIGLQLKPNTA
jgi:circadian clock protein KaiB